MGRITTRKIITELKKMKKNFQVDRMLLFGSRARGDELLTSDVDVIAISKNFRRLSFKKRPNRFLDAWKMPIDLEILCYSPEELERKRQEFGIVRRALEEGREI